MSFLSRIFECNDFHESGLRPFYAAGRQVGWVSDSCLCFIRQHPSVFEIGESTIGISRRLNTYSMRTAAIREVTKSLVRCGAVSVLSGEDCIVKENPQSEPLLQMDRSCVSYFGICGFGVHLNGYVRSPTGLQMWIAQRSTTRESFPGQFDNVVAGGQPAGLTIAQTLVKECGEEAGIPIELANRAVFCGNVSYRTRKIDGVKASVLACYDLEIPAGFIPTCNDDEVERFYLWPIEHVVEVVRDTMSFKFNCNLVIIDFLVRHGVIGKSDRDYTRIVEGLKGPFDGQVVRTRYTTPGVST